MASDLRSTKIYAIQKILKKQRTHAQKSATACGVDSESYRKFEQQFQETFNKMRRFVRAHAIGDDTLITATQYLHIYFDQKLAENRFDAVRDISEFEVTGLVALRLAMKHQDAQLEHYEQLPADDNTTLLDSAERQEAPLSTLANDQALEDSSESAYQLILD